MNSQTDNNRITDIVEKECSKNVPTSPFPTSPFPTEGKSVSTQTPYFNSPPEVMMNYEANMSAGVPSQLEEYNNKFEYVYRQLKNTLAKSKEFRDRCDDRVQLIQSYENDAYLCRLAMDAQIETLQQAGIDEKEYATRLRENAKLTEIINEEMERMKWEHNFIEEAKRRHRQELEENKREEKRMKKHLKKLQKEGERIAKMTDEEIATAKVMKDLEADRLKEIQDKKDIAFASQFIEKEVKVQPTKTKKEKKRGNPYQKMLTLSREAGIKTINPDWVKWENENK